MAECLVIPQALRNGVSIILLSSRDTAPTQERTKPRAYTPTVLIVFSYSHFSPDGQLSVATNLANCCCFCFLLALLPLLFSTWPDSHPHLLLLVHGVHTANSQIGTLFLYMVRDARNICSWIKGDTGLFSMGGDFSVCWLFYTLCTSFRERNEMKIQIAQMSLVTPNKSILLSNSNKTDYCFSS